MEETKYTPAHEFNLRDRIQSIGANSVVLKGNDGEKIFCHRNIFNRLLENPGIGIRIVTVKADAKCHMDTLWIEALLPMRVMAFPHWR